MNSTGPALSLQWWQVIVGAVGQYPYLVIMNSTGPALSLQWWQVIVGAVGQNPLPGNSSVERVLFILQTSSMVTADYNIYIQN